MFMVGWVDLFIIGCVNMFNVGWVDVYVVGSVVSLRPSELPCSWSSELTGIFRSGWLTSLWLGGLTWVRWFLYSSGELVCLWPREVTGIFMFIAV